MTTENIAAEDTTFKNVKAERVWLSFSNLEKENYLTVTLEINGIKKVINEFYIPGLSRNEGLTSYSHNLTWILP
jgi:hypothetical protein